MYEAYLNNRSNISQAQAKGLRHILEHLEKASCFASRYVMLLSRYATAFIITWIIVWHLQASGDIRQVCKNLVKSMPTH